MKIRKKIKLMENKRKKDNFKNHNIEVGLRLNEKLNTYTRVNSFIHINIRNQNEYKLNGQFIL